MNKAEITDHLRDILDSDAFLERLQKIAKNYPNLKQEIHIRNVILEIFNHYNSFETSLMKAVAEHRVDQKRVDLCFINRHEPKNPLQVELKFQFSKDFNRFMKYRPTIEADLEKRKSDAFILIVAHWNVEKKKEYDRIWNLTPDLNKYICKKGGEVPAWKSNLHQLLNSFERTSVELIEKSVEEPYPVEYNFYLLIKHTEEEWAAIGGEKELEAVHD